MRICCAQISQVYEDVDTAFARAAEYLASADADMVIFSEQYATGWRPAASAADAECVKARWISMAKEYHTCIVGSYQKPAGGKPQNVMLVCSPSPEKSNGPSRILHPQQRQLNANRLHTARRK